MSKLANVKTGREPMPRRIVLYGTAGIGKSTTATQAPSPIFIPTDDGLSEVDCHRFELCMGFADAMKCVEQLYKDDHSYKSVILDTFDGLETLIFAEIAREKGVRAVEEIPYGKGFAIAKSYWAKLFLAFDALRSKKGMDIILIGHSKVERIEHPDTEAFDRWTLRTNKHGTAMLMDWVDAVLFASYKVHTKAEDQGFGRTRVRGIGSGERVVKTQERPAHIAKNRYGFPFEMPLTGEVFTHQAASAAKQEN